MAHNHEVVGSNPSPATKKFNMALWRNWQARMLEGHMGKPVPVRLRPRSQGSKDLTTNVFSCLVT